MAHHSPKEIPQIFAPGIISQKGRFEVGFSISPDGKSMAFGVVHESDSEENAIYMMNLADGKWTTPKKMIVPDKAQTFFPMFGPDGNDLYFAKKSADDETDLWVSKYANNQIQNQQPVGSKINSNSREAGHGKSLKGSFYFTSNRDDKHKCCGDIFVAKKDEMGNYTSISRIDELSTDADEESLYLSPCEDYIIIQSWKNEYQTKHDLYVSYRNVNYTWTTPVRLDPNINSPDIEQRPFISPDKKYLFFNRVHEQESDLYWVSTKRIFKPYVYNANIHGNVSIGRYFNILLPSDLFKDIDDSKLTLTATLNDGTKLPRWISFNPRKLSFTGIYRKGGSMSITVTATDKYGNTGQYQFELNALQAESR